MRAVALELRRPAAAFLVAVLVGDVLLALSAHIQFPFWPVRLSMQSAVVLAIGLFGGWRIGAATLLAYLVEGASGLPVFQAGAGLAYTTGPTGGYLLGYLAAATAVGVLAERGASRSLVGLVVTLLVGEVLIFAPGLAWLAASFGVTKAVAVGLTPFLSAEAAKVALVGAASYVLRRPG